jgi:site-specific recombinase XerD
MSGLAGTWMTSHSAPQIQQWIEEVRPLLSPGAHPALWVTERRGRLSRRAINEAFEEARDAAGLGSVLDLHCLRHSSAQRLDRD